MLSIGSYQLWKSKNPGRGEPRQMVEAIRAQEDYPHTDGRMIGRAAWGQHGYLAEKDFLDSGKLFKQSNVYER